MSVSPVGQDVSDGFITEADEKTAQSFISQQIFRVPEAARETEPIKQTYRQIRFKNNTACHETSDFMTEVSEWCA